MEFVIHNINPVILPIFGPIAIRWYGFAYLIGSNDISSSKELVKKGNI